MPDGRLLHLRDTYPIETAWAPQYVGAELRQVRAAAREARLAGLRASAKPPGRDAILQPPKPEIRPSPYVLERAADRDTDWEAAD